MIDTKLFLLFNKWARDIDKEIRLMYRHERFYSVDILSVADAFRDDCISFLSAKYKRKRSPYERRFLISQYAHAQGLYTMIASRAYYRLLYAPFKLYSALDYNEMGAYKAIFDYAFTRLIELNIYTTEDKARAVAQLEKVSTLCDQLKMDGEFMQW